METTAISIDLPSKSSGFRIINTKYRKYETLIELRKDGCRTRTHVTPKMDSSLLLQRS